MRSDPSQLWQTQDFSDLQIVFTLPSFRLRREVWECWFGHWQTQLPWESDNSVMVRGGVLSQEFVCWILLTYSEMYVVVYRLRKHQYNGKSRREGCYAGERILWKNVSSGKILKWAICWRKQIPEHHWSSLWSEVRQRECWTAAWQCCMWRKMTVGRQEVVLGVWDTAGSERYESMTKMYYR